MTDESVGEPVQGKFSLSNDSHLQKNFSPKSLILGILSIFFLLLSSHANAEVKEEKPMVIAIASYNNIRWHQANLSSLFMQKYHNFRIIYINDDSTDGTGEAVESYLKNHGVDYLTISFDDSFSEDIEEVTSQFALAVNKEPHFFILVNNVHRCGGLENIYRAAHSCKDHEIFLSVDGDDWLYHDRVLEELNDVYSSREIWFTHGTLIEYPTGNVAWCEPIPPHILNQKAFRQFKCPSHLKTFYTWLFKKIKLDDLLWNGKFFSMTGDMAIMYPLCEMAEERHYFVSQPNYVYNIKNPVNDNKVDPQLQNEIDRHIRNKERYQRIE